MINARHRVARASEDDRILKPSFASVPRMSANWRELLPPTQTFPPDSVLNLERLPVPEDLGQTNWRVSVAQKSA